MNWFSYAEFLNRRDEFDRSVVGTSEVAGFCSSANWQVAANGFLHESEAETKFLIVEEGGNWLLFVDRDDRGIWFPMESAWMFGCPMIGDPAECVSMLKGAVIRRLASPAGFCVGGVRKNGSLHRELLSLREESLRFEEFPATDCMVIDLEAGYEAWLSRRSTKFRKSVRQSSGADGFEIIDASCDAPDALFRRIFSVQKQTSKWRDGSDIFHGADYVRFYRYLIEKLHESGQLRILFAQQAGVDSAYILGGDFSDQYRGLQMSYAESVRDSGIGNVLQLENLRRCADDGILEYDLGMHAPYKERWADRQDVYVTVFVVL